MLTPARALFFGTLTVGTLDALDAIVFFGLRGVAPIRVLQSIAGGLLGREAFQGGLPTALLGTLIHFFIAFVIVTTYFLAARKLPSLTDRPFLYGPLYGLLVYVIMTFVVVPLSALRGGVPSAAVALNGVLIHAAGVGLPSAIFATAARPAPDTPAPPSAAA